MTSGKRQNKNVLRPNTPQKNEEMADYKKEISRLRSEVRQIKQNSETKKDISPFTGAVSGNYWTQTGMPWIQSEGRKAVLTEWFWQPIRGQPRRVDTNELRQFAQTYWVSSCVFTVIDELTSLDWDILPKEDLEYKNLETEIERIKSWLEYPNKNNESWLEILRTLVKDLLEIDASVLVKVFDIESYDFEQLEPKSGAPLLKPKGQRTLTELYSRDGASFLKETDKFGFVSGYWQYSYQIPAHPMWFNRDEICYISEHPRSMSVYGYSRTQAVLDVVKSLHYSLQYNKKYFEDFAIPDGVLGLEETNETEMKDFMNYWNNEFKAQPHKLAVINKKISWQPFNISNKELEWLESQKWYYKMVITMFGLTPTELGISEDSNRATSATQAEVSKRKGIRPLIKLLEKKINKEIIEELTNAPVEFQFVYDDPAEKNARLTNWQMELNMGIKTPNEVRNELGLTPIDGGDLTTHQRAEQQMNQQSGAGGEGKVSGYENTRNREEGKPTSKGIYSPNIDEIKRIADKYMFSGDLEQLKMGVEVEQEHAQTVGYDLDTTIRIALDHLKEDALYYTKLNEMEKELKKKDFYKETAEFQGNKGHWVTSHGKHLFITEGGEALDGKGNKVEGGKEDKPKEDKTENKPENKPEQESDKPKKENDDMSERELYDYSIKKNTEIKQEHKEKIFKYINDIKNKKDTYNLYKQNNTWTPERTELHRKIRQEYAESAIGIRKGRQPGGAKVIFMAGAPGSGKTTATKGLFTKVEGSKVPMVKDKNGIKYLVLNADDIKAKLPEYDDGLGAMIVHEESSEINADLMNKMRKLGVNLLIDGTFGDPDKAKKKINAFKESKYQTTMIFVDVKTKKAIDRAEARYKKHNRFVNYPLIAQYGMSIPKSIESLKNESDNYIHIDNNEDNNPKIIDRRGEEL